MLDLTLQELDQLEESLGYSEMNVRDRPWEPDDLPKKSEKLDRIAGIKRKVAAEKKRLSLPGSW